MAKILIIEDNQVFAEMYQNKLKSVGYDVEVAFDGEDGVDKARSTSPDLIILDIILPKLDGVQVLKILREDSATEDIPVLMLTNIYSDKEMQAFEEAKVSGYLIKSEVTVDEVIERVGKILEDQKKQLDPLEY